MELFGGDDTVDIRHGSGEIQIEGEPQYARVATGAEIAEDWINEHYSGRVAVLFGVLSGKRWYTLALTLAQFRALAVSTIESKTVPGLEWFSLGVRAERGGPVMTIATPNPERFEGWKNPEHLPKP